MLLKESETQAREELELASHNNERLKLELVEFERLDLDVEDT